jgi:sialic acid synthase SpsE
MSALCKNAKTAWRALGHVDYSIKASEQSNVKFRRSLYFVKDLSAGEIVTPQHVRSVRPGFGLAPKHIENVIGKRAKYFLRAATPVNWDSFE